MRILIIGFAVFLSACNGSSTSTPDNTQAKLDKLTQALAAATHIQAQQTDTISKLQLFGKPSGVTAERVMAIGAAAQTINFGPCADMGVKVGSIYKSGPLDEQFQAFKQTKTDICPGVYAEYEVKTGNLRQAPRIFFDGPNCTGNAFEWDSGGQGYDRQKLASGVSFISPFDGSLMWVAPGTQPINTQVASIFTIDNGTCDVDLDFQPMWLAVVITTAESGVPTSVGPDYQVTSP